jgi:hypothetical protein
MMRARREAAAKLCKNHDVVLSDILERSGMYRHRTSQYGGTLSAPNGNPPQPSYAFRQAVDHALRRLGHYLVTGYVGPKHPDLEGRALGAAAMAYFRNRASAPRDLSGAACNELRAACDAILRETY